MITAIVTALLVTISSAASTTSAAAPANGVHQRATDSHAEPGTERLEAVPLDDVAVDSGGNGTDRDATDTPQANGAPGSNDVDFNDTVSDLASDANATVVATSDAAALVDVPTEERSELEAELLAAGIELREPVSVDVRPTGEADARQIDGVTEQLVEVPQFGSLSSSAVGVTGADKWHAAGFDGTGVKIGVIDYFDTRYWSIDEHGPLPVAGTNAKCFDAGADCTTEFFDGQDLGGERHGVAVVEVIRDMAPGAQIFLGQASTITDYYSILHWFNANGVTIVSRSLGARYDSPGDGTGPLADVAAEAETLGMVWVNAAGNAGDGRYYRHQVRLIGNEVAFGPSGDVTRLPFKECVSLGGIRWANDWYVPTNQRTDFDAYLWEAPAGNLAAAQRVLSSERRQSAGASPLEGFGSTVCPDPGKKLYLQVVWRSGPRYGDTLEILDYEDGIDEFTQPEYSATTSVATSRSRAVLSVGAIDPPKGTLAAAYSSRGPSNDGRIVPSVTAPSGFESSIYGTFGGTSAAAPVVAGAAAVLTQAGQAKYNYALADLIRASVIDRGAPGPDNTYGTGQLRLSPPTTSSLPVAPSTYTSLIEPTRLLDTRPATAVGPANLIGRTRPGEIRRLPVAGVAGIPANATAVAINLVTDAPDVAGYVQSYPTGYGSVALYSNVNTDGPFQTRANLAIIPVGVDGTISLYAVVGGDLVVDALGYFVPAGPDVAAGRFESIGVPQRLLDTRKTGGKLRTGSILDVPMPKGVNTNDVAALVVTVTGVQSSDPAWIQAYPRGRPSSAGKTSTVNLEPKVDMANLAIVPTTGGGISLTADVVNGGSTDVVVDVVGYITSDSAPLASNGRFVPVVPSRALDTRLSVGRLTGADVRTVRGSDAPGVTVPATATGIVWNATATESLHSGYAAVWAPNTTKPETSTLNWWPDNRTQAAAVIAGATNGASNFQMASDFAPSVPIAALVVDVFGYFT